MQTRIHALVTESARWDRSVRSRSVGPDGARPLDRGDGHGQSVVDAGGGVGADGAVAAAAGDWLAVAVPSRTLDATLALGVGGSSGLVRSVLPLVLVGFLVVTALALVATRPERVRPDGPDSRSADGRGRPRVRRAFVGGLLAVLVVSSVVGASPYPFVDLHLYSPAAPAALGVYELRVVDADGRELRYDTRAIPPYTNARLNWLGTRIVDGDDATRTATAAFLLDRAERHRASVRAAEGRVLPDGHFPHHVLDYRWTADRVAGYGPFVAVRVYAVSVYFAADGRSVDARTERLAVEVVPAASSTLSPSPSPSTTPTAGPAATPATDPVAIASRRPVGEPDGLERDAPTAVPLPPAVRVPAATVLPPEGRP
jgi:hypothetical protein